MTDFTLGFIFGAIFAASVLVLATLAAARGAERRAKIVNVLSAGGEFTGLDLVRLGVSARAMVYVDLARLEDQGQVVARIGPDGRRYYRRRSAA